METRKIVTYEYVVTDAFGKENVFERKAEAIDFEKHVKAMRKVIGYIRPNGVTLVVSRDEDVFYKSVPAFIGIDGKPFMECTKDKRREHFRGNVPHTWHCDVYGNIVEVLKQAFERASYWIWETEYGETQCGYILNEYHWQEGALWYNWDGEQFTTNDPDCKITTKDFNNI